MSKTRTLWWVLVAFLIMALAGCVGGQVTPPPPSPPPAPVSLTVSAAASLTDVLNELIASYQAENPAVTITPNFASSGSLQAQIEEGAPVDVFISAAPRNMNVLEEKGLLLEGTRFDLLGNTLVLVAREGLQISSFDDLAEDTVRKIAVGEPESVPAGRYAKETLTYLGLWDKLEPKFVFAKDVRQVLAWVEGGDADAGMVYLTDAKMVEAVSVVSNAPEGSHKPILYPAAVVKNSPVPEEAKAFLAFLASEAASDVFVRYGFTVFVR